MKRLPLLALALAPLWGSCGPAGSDGPSVEEFLAQATQVQRRLIEDARETVAHSGLRRIETNQAGRPLVYRERIVTAGDGRYSIQPVDSPDASIQDWGLFELLQEAREGFLYRYRDFQVRDRRLFLRNWRFAETGPARWIAGRSCTSLRVERRTGTTVVYELGVDTESGLVLESREFNAAGELRCAMVYETFELNPDVTGVAWHEPRNAEQRLDDRRDVREQIGEDVLQPRLLPAGYGPLELATVGDGGGARWLKRTYSDGIAPLFFFQRIGETESGRVPQSIADLGSRPSSVVVFEVGAATVVQGTVADTELMVIGTVVQAELLDLIESALP